MPSTRAGYCHQCEAARAVLQTVPWQADACAVCGSADVDVA